MKELTIIAIAAVSLTSCSTTRAFINPDKSISISHRGSLEMPVDLWVSGAAEGAVTPASRLKVIQTTRIKGVHRRELECAGFIDRTKPNKIELQIAKTGNTFASPTWSKHPFNGTYKLHPSDNRLP